MTSLKQPALVTIFYTRFDEPLPETQLNYLLDLLPADQKERNARFVRWQDRHSHLFGRMLLLRGLEMYGFSEEVLSSLEYTKHNRPYLSDNLDFNISHSGRYVLCAISKKVRLGVDIEEVKDISFKDFRKIMAKEQWEDIECNENPVHTFFKYWTIKESVIKADSRGLSIPLEKLEVEDNRIFYDDNTWHLHYLDIDPDYCACLATNVEDVNIALKFLDFYREPLTFNK